MSESNENLAEALRFVAELESSSRNEIVPLRRTGWDSPSMLLNEDGVPIVLDGRAVDFEHLVKLSQVVHPATIEVSTLQAVVDYEGDMKSGFIRIEDEYTVEVMSSAVAANGSRSTFLRANFRRPINLFGDWLTVDEFSTWLLSGFVPNDDSEALYQAIGTGVKHEAAREARDGAGGTEIRTSEGIKVTWHQGIGPRFQLAFICSFPEIDQPERACVFRARNGEAGIEVRLVDADGGAWKRTAIARIKTWLEGHDELQGVTILG